MGDRGSMSCVLPIANCKPMCYDSMCNKTHGCECSQCDAVGKGKTWDWLAWANLENSATSTPTEKACTGQNGRQGEVSSLGVRNCIGPVAVIQLFAITLGT